jgi:uncharacterized protein YkwD
MRSLVGFFSVALVVPVAPCRPGVADEPKDAPFALTAAEKKLVELVNLERKKHKLPPLTPAPLLCQAAREHAANMARQGKLAHALDGKDQFQRIKGAGYRYRYAAENVARGEVEMEEIVQGWMASQGHREAILSDKYTETGVGIARDGKDVIYYAQEFARPRPKVTEDP